MNGLGANKYSVHSSASFKPKPLFLLQSMSQKQQQARNANGYRTGEPVTPEMPVVKKQVEALFARHNFPVIEWMEEFHPTQTYWYNAELTSFEFADDASMIEQVLRLRPLNGSLPNMWKALQEQQQKANVETVDYGVRCTFHNHGTGKDAVICLYYTPRWDAYDDTPIAAIVS